MTTIITLILQVAIVFFLFKIQKSCATMADETERKKELTDAIERFGTMFADVAEKRKKKAVDVLPDA